MQDASLQESMGPIVDRTKENLVSTDNGIIMARHRLMRAAKALTDKRARFRRASIGATAGALGRRGAAARPGVQGCRPGGPHGAPRRGAGVGVAVAEIASPRKPA